MGAIAARFIGRRVHFAWIVAGLIFLVLLTGAGIRATPGVLIVLLEEKFGWTRASISLAIGINIFIYGFIGPFAAAGPRMRLGPLAMRMAFWCLIYSALVILLAFVIAALWAAGNETMPIAAGTAHGSALEENLIRWMAYSSAPTGIASFALILWGLRLDKH